MKTVYFAKAIILSTMIMLVAAFTGQPAQASDPSFDCSRAHRAAEIAVCESRRLARLDRRLAYWYRKAMERAYYFDDTHGLRNEQRQWLKGRNACGYDRHCLRHKYRSRIRALRRYATHV